MRAIGEAGYILTTNEFSVIAGMTGCKKLIGINGSKDIIGDLEKVKSGLTAKKYLRETEEGCVIDKNISYLVKACCDPSFFIRFIESRDGRKRYRYYYITKDIIVELDQDILRKDTFILTPITSAEKAVRNMEEFFHIEPLSGKLDSRMFSNSFSIDQDILRSMTEGDTDRPKADLSALFSDAGLDGSLVQDLIYALNENDGSYSMLLINFGDDRTYHSSDIYSGRKYLWKVTGSQEQQGKAVISPGSREDMGIAAEQFIDTIKGIVF